ncbi:MAG: cysteine--tRNA ligase [Syntrophales bacterium]|jgi:cysteinyl-tRNA synthetase|nr:cysteine--tRNA ligase [Syntrophales bacterium]
MASTLKVYNTQTRKKEVFEPLTAGKVGLYVCGITAYDTCHIGHARSAVVFDVIARFFRYRGYEVTFVKNFTDVDDKIIGKANASGRSIEDVAEQYILEHNEDMDAMGVQRPTVTPRATDHIGDMVRLIEMLLEKNLAYVSDGDVYFSVEAFPGYGKLSGRGLEEMMAGARVDVNDKKRNPLDFALWKGSKENEPWWESPWGKGRPGWHIECSVMSQRYLGDTFDIHGGGADLVFPHHENEMAQSEGATGKPFARYWMHNGFVRVNHEKMSKSLGNFSTIREMLKQHHPETLRLFILQSHYRSPLDFLESSIHEARLGLERFYSLLKSIKDIVSAPPDAATPPAESFMKPASEMVDRIRLFRVQFIEAMEDDFNTARAIGYLFDMVRQANNFLELAGKDVTSAEKVGVARMVGEVMEEIGGVLGLFQEDPDKYFHLDREREVAKRALDINEIERLLEKRNVARSRKDWAEADRIRHHLVAQGIILKDGADGTTWMVA